MGVSSPPRGVTRFGVFELDAHSGELRKNGIRIKLQQQPLQILSLLSERPGEVVTARSCGNGFGRGTFT